MLIAVSVDAQNSAHVDCSNIAHISKTQPVNHTEPIAWLSIIFEAGNAEYVRSMPAVYVIRLSGAC